MIMCLAERPYLDSWTVRIPYLNAKVEERRLRMYEMDLAWLNVKGRYEGLPQPSKVGKKDTDSRSAEQIKNHILNKLKGVE